MLACARMQLGFPKKGSMLFVIITGQFGGYLRFQIMYLYDFFYALNVPFLFIIVECVLKKRRVFTITLLRPNSAYVMYYLGIL